MIQVKVGTTENKACPSGIPEAGWVLFDGSFFYEADTFTPAMVWDAGLNNVRAMNQADRDAREAARLQALYTQAKALLTAEDHVSKKEKAVLLVILDEFNAHANKINAILTAIDGAASFAAMKTAIAAIADYPQRIAVQIKTSVSNKIDAGQADG